MNYSGVLIFIRKNFPLINKKFFCQPFGLNWIEFKCCWSVSLSFVFYLIGENFVEERWQIYLFRRRLFFPDNDFIQQSFSPSSFWVSFKVVYYFIFLHRSVNFNYISNFLIFILKNVEFMDVFSSNKTKDGR